MNEEQHFNQIKSIENLNFQKIIDLAKNNLPNEKRLRPWSYINHGIDLLHTTDDLNCYLAAYGNMHEAKIKTALSSIQNANEFFNNEISIIDWGCGQGLATLCFLDYLNTKNISNNVQSIILIEPSIEALNRAKLYVSSFLKENIKIKTINKYLNDVEFQNIKTNQPITIHFFSNILDITTIDLEKLAKLITNDIRGEHYFFCVGPLNSKSTRIEKFAEFLNISEEKIIEKNQGKLITTRGTIKLLVFKIKGQKIEIIKTDFYPKVPNNKNYISMIENILTNVNPNEMNRTDKIIQFYKAVVELEQQKEPDVKEFYQYPLNNINSNSVSLDLEINTEFYNKFLTNSNPQETRWPKDLFIGINATIEEKTYNLLHYIIPYNEIQNFDINSNQIPVNISDFEISLKAFEKLELIDEDISKIEERIKQQETFSEIFDVLEEVVDVKLERNILYLALSSKNLALSQVLSELRKINSHTINNGSLIEYFLNYQKFNNIIDDLQEEDLIQISNLDKSQKNAVLTAFNNKLSVITGPPGSGKTQVILNILANAVIQNKKVLVASKINKAVDNVKDRFDKIDNSGYFLRFGSKNLLRENTLPAIDRIVNLIPTLTQNEDKVIELKETLKKHKQNIKKGKNILLEKERLLIQIPQTENKINNLNNQSDDLIKKNKDLNNIRNHFEINDLEKIISSLKIERNIIEAKNYGIKKIFFNWFSKGKYAKEILNTIETYPFEIKNYLQKQGFKTKVSEFKNGDDILQLYTKLINIFTSAIDYANKIRLFDSELEKLNKELSNDRNTVKKITDSEEEIKSSIKKSEQSIIVLGKPLILEMIKSKLISAEIPAINSYKSYLPDNIPWRNEELIYFIEDTKLFLDIFKINSVTSLSTKAAFPLEGELFDMVVIDEASQCDIPSVIPLIFRTKQLVIIGDPLQLKHISMVNDYEETFIREKLLIDNSVFLNYNKKSLWDYSKELLSLTDKPNNHPVMIDSHYRCHPQIIGYSSEAFYKKFFNRQLRIYTTDEQFQIVPKGIIWVDVVGEQMGNDINVNMVEVQKSIEIATMLANRHNNISIGIVTPFRHQAERISKHLPNNFRDRIVADTVYKFQGDEKDIMIYSLVVTDNSPDRKINWIDTSFNLVNVAVTRAKNTLYIVGNKEYIKRKSNITKPLGKLIKYVER